MLTLLLPFLTVLDPLPSRAIGEQPIQLRLMGYSPIALAGQGSNCCIATLNQKTVQPRHIKFRGQFRTLSYPILVLQLDSSNNSVCDALRINAVLQGPHCIFLLSYPAVLNWVMLYQLSDTRQFLLKSTHLDQGELGNHAMSEKNDYFLRRQTFFRKVLFGPFQNGKKFLVRN